MRFAIVNVEEQLDCHLPSGDLMKIGPGEIHGIVHTQRFSDPDRSIGEDCGWLRLTFSFADKAANPYVYNNIVRPHLLWPTPQTVVTEGSGHFKAETTLKCVMDTSETEPIRFKDGRSLKSHHKYNDVKIELRTQECDVLVRLTVYIGELTKGTEHSYLSMDYVLPWSHLLWRSAAKYYEDDIAPESEEFFPIDPKRGGGLTKGVKLSPIELVKPGAASGSYSEADIERKNRENPKCSYHQSLCRIDKDLVDQVLIATDNPEFARDDKGWFQVNEHEWTKIVPKRDVTILTVGFGLGQGDS